MKKLSFILNFLGFITFTFLHNEKLGSALFKINKKLQGELLADQILEDGVLEEEVLADEMLEDEVLGDELSANEMLADELFLGEVIGGELLADELLNDEILLNELLENELLADEMLADEMLEKELIAYEILGKEEVKNNFHEIFTDELLTDEMMARNLADMKEEPKIAASEPKRTFSLQDPEMQKHYSPWESLSAVEHFGSVNNEEKLPDPVAAAPETGPLKEEPKIAASEPKRTFSLQDPEMQKHYSPWESLSAVEHFGSVNNEEKLPDPVAAAPETGPLKEEPKIAASEPKRTFSLQDPEMQKHYSPWESLSAVEHFGSVNNEEKLPDPVAAAPNLETGPVKEEPKIAASEPKRTFSLQDPEMQKHYSPWDSLSAVEHFGSVNNEEKLPDPVAAAPNLETSLETGPVKEEPKIAASEPKRTFLLQDPEMQKHYSPWESLSAVEHFGSVNNEEKLPDPVAAAPSLKNVEGINKFRVPRAFGLFWPALDSFPWGDIKNIDILSRKRLKKSASNLLSGLQKEAKIESSKPIQSDASLTQHQSPFSPREPELQKHYRPWNSWTAFEEFDAASIRNLTKKELAQAKPASRRKRPDPMTALIAQGEKGASSSANSGSQPVIPNHYPIPKSISEYQMFGQTMGCSEGYTSLQMMVAPDYSSWNAFPFLDVRGHYFNNDTYGANFGVGGRYLIDQFPMIAGLNTFYDYREGRYHSFHQMGLGIELLGKRWSFEANGYFPLGEKKHVLTCKFHYPNNYFEVRRRFESSFSGFNASLDWLAVQSGNFSIYASGGPYFLSGELFPSIWGGQISLQPQYSDYVGLVLNVSHDPLLERCSKVGLSFHCLCTDLPLLKTERALTGFPIDKSINL